MQPFQGSYEFRKLNLVKRGFNSDPHEEPLELQILNTSLHPIPAEFTLAFFKRRIALFELAVSINEGQDCDADVKIAVLDVEKRKHQKHQRDDKRCYTCAFFCKRFADHRKSPENRRP
jgi:hypothetical protein